MKVDDMANSATLLGTRRLVLVLSLRLLQLLTTSYLVYYAIGMVFRLHVPWHSFPVITHPSIPAIPSPSPTDWGVVHAEIRQT